MKKNTLYRYIAMGSGLLLIIGVFLPYVSLYGISTNMWETKSFIRILSILLGLATILLYAMNYKTELTYMVSGFFFFSAINSIVNNDGFKGFSIGFYAMFIASIAIGVAAYLYKEEEGKSLLNMFMQKRNNGYNPNMMQQNYMYNQNMQQGYNSNMNQVPMNNSYMNQAPMNNGYNSNMVGNPTVNEFVNQNNRN